VERTLLHSPFRCELQRLVSVDFTRDKDTLNIDQSKSNVEERDRVTDRQNSQLDRQTDRQNKRQMTRTTERQSQSVDSQSGRHRCQETWWS
jgi:hypothetical protein